MAWSIKKAAHPNFLGEMGSGPIYDKNCPLDGTIY